MIPSVAYTVYSLNRSRWWTRIGLLFLSTFFLFLLDDRNLFWENNSYFLAVPFLAIGCALETDASGPVAARVGSFIAGLSTKVIFCSGMLQIVKNLPFEQQSAEFLFQWFVNMLVSIVLPFVKIEPGGRYMWLSCYGAHLVCNVLGLVLLSVFVDQTWDDSAKSRSFGDVRPYQYDSHAIHAQFVTLICFLPALGWDGPRCRNNSVKLVLLLLWLVLYH